MRIVVTGANGYIGKHLGKKLNELGYYAIAAVRSKDVSIMDDFQEIYHTGDINLKTKWIKVLGNIDCVVHLAARAHVTSEYESDPLSIFQVVNRDGTINLARQSVAAGVKRFIYISSIGVLGNNTVEGVFTNHSAYNPVEPYAISKMEAEQGLISIGKNSNMEIVIVRPPLVYGPSAPGNFNKLLSLVVKGFPLPLGAFHEKKSMVSLDNLTDFLLVCIKSKAAANQNFVISDGGSWSTVELIHLLSKYMKKNIFLVPIPIFILKFLGKITGRLTQIEKLSQPLEIDSSQTMRILNWKPQQLPEIAIKQAVDSFMGNEKNSL